MAVDWSPKREKIEGRRSYNVDTTIFENKTRESRLITPDELISFTITTPQLTKTQYTEYKNFFQSKYSSLTSFTMLYPFDDTEYTVCFVEGSWKEIFESGTYQITFELERVF